jgi:dienelactone hydrolase
MPDTHCLPTGSLGTSQSNVPQVPAGATVLTPSGSKRGVVVLLHGLGQLGSPSVLPPVLQNFTGPWDFLTLADDLQTDSWIVLFATQVGDAMDVASQTQAVYNDVTNDTGNGSRLLATTLAWWDHVVLWVKATYGDWPIVVVGGSWGGWHALQLAINRAATLTAYCAHHPASVLSDLNPSVVSPSFASVNTTGLNVGATALNNVSIPGLLGWGTSDNVVGASPWTSDTLTPAIYSAASGAGAPVTSNSQAEAHVMGSADVTVITGWFTSTVDPLAPAVH